MMKTIGKAFAKKLFGAKYERLPRTLLMDLIVFWGLSIAGLRVQIAPSVRIFMVSAFSAGVMWQALSSKDNAAEMQHMLMLPFGRREFVFSYVAMLGAYTVFTKTGLLLAVLLAVTRWDILEIAGILVCVVNAVCMAAIVYALKKYWYAGMLWAAAIAAVIFLLGNQPWIWLLLLVNGMSAVLSLWRADGYDFCRWERKKNSAIKQRNTASLWRYLFRYLVWHKNYLLNMAVMWGVAAALPYFLGEIEGFVFPVGFGILSLNTPICILLSCDRDLEQAVRFLPGQKTAFGIPYCLFIFFCNLAADVIFLISWQIGSSSVTVPLIAWAVFFALQSAVLSVLLEWFYPVRNWKIESDLWHHPRKYIVPGAMLLLATAVCALPKLLPVCLVLLALEIVVFLWFIE